MAGRRKSNLPPLARSRGVSDLALLRAPADALMQSADLLAGLGAANRHLLATCLGLFEDSTLSRRLDEIYPGVT